MAKHSPNPPSAAAAQPKPKPQLREKITELGPDALSIPELLAIIFNTGAGGQSVEELAQRVIHEYGSIGMRDARDVRALQRETHLPYVKACMLIACFELGRRLFTEQKRTAGSFIIRSPLDVCAYVNDMRSLRKEQLRGLYLNARNAIIHDEVISLGTVTANLVCPRDVLLPAITYSAVSVIVVHNHPSGNPEPSDDDIAVTAQLAQAASVMGIKLLDHIIIGDEQHPFRSLSEMGLV